MDPLVQMFRKVLLTRGILYFDQLRTHQARI